MLPGVPHLLKSKWEVVEERLSGPGGEERLLPFHNVLLRLSEGDETRIAPALAAVQAEAGESPSLAAVQCRGRPCNGMWRETPSP